MTELPRYQSHKIVEAAPIIAMHSVTVVVRDHPREMWQVSVNIDDTPTPILVPFDTFKRATPQVGDYLVKYLDQPDGNPYWSWSPRLVFEAGYDRLASGGSE